MAIIIPDSYFIGTYSGDSGTYNITSADSSVTYTTSTRSGDDGTRTNTSDGSNVIVISDGTNRTDTRSNSDFDGSPRGEDNTDTRDTDNTSDPRSNSDFDGSPRGEDNTDPREDDGSPPRSNVVPSGTLILNYRSEPLAAEVYINEVATGLITPAQGRYDDAEFLEWKTISVKKSGFGNSTRYRIKVGRIRDTTTGIGRNIYAIQKMDSNGVWQSFREVIAEGEITYITLDFKSERSISTTGGGSGGSTDVGKYFVQIIGDVPAENIIMYRTSDGKEAFVRDTTQTVEIAHTIQGQLPWIEFQRVGITNDTHNVRYTITNPNSTSSDTRTSDFKKEITNGTTIVQVVVNKIVNVSNSSTTPRISIDVSSLEYNINAGTILNIPYSTVNADKVVYTIGNIKREVGSQGSIRLSAKDFTKGLGVYTLFAQPVSNRYGSGEYEQVKINVVSKSYRSGPDITHINYPYNIKGSDFKGYDEDFVVSWQSVNTNYIQIFAGRRSSSTSLARVAPNGSITLNVQQVLRKAGTNFNENTDAISFKLVLVPFNTEGDSQIVGKEETVTIVFDKSDLKLRRAQVLYDLIEAFKRECKKDILEQYTSKYLTHFAHFGDADNKLITTWATDTETFSEYQLNENTNQLVKVKDEKALVLKLYEPLPTSVQPNEQLWISKIQSLTIFEQITLTDDEVSDCILLEPNFSLNLGDDIGYQILDDLTASGSVTSTQLVEEYINKNEFSTAKLNIQYETGSDYYWSNFVKYSSAEERIENFFYKVKAIEFYQNKLVGIESASLATTSSLAVNNERIRVSSSIDNLKKGFDAFENFMYSESSSISYPGAGGSAVSASDDTIVDSWYGSAISSAQNYDRFNQDSLINNIPAHITQDSNNAEFVLFFNMIGHHFDVLWSYINGFRDSKKIMHTNEMGMINDLVYHMLESLGWDADMGVKSQVLWEYAFGQYKDGTTVSTMTGKERQQEIWRRILNNLPYLYKYKGTKRAVHAAMACYGVPSSMLTIMEFGGPTDPTQTGTTQFTFDDRTAAISFDGNASILVPWTTYTGSARYPDTIEMRINTEVVQEHTLVSGSGMILKIIPSGSGNNTRAALVLETGGNVATSSYMPFYNDLYTNVAITRTISGSNYVWDMFMKEAFNERIRNEASGTLIFTTGSTTWQLGDELTIGEGFVGTMDEFRLWAAPISESRLENHTLLPDAIDGNHVSASTEDLIFRLDFEYPKDRTLDTAILNVSINQLYGNGYATASNFPAANDYPYQYVPYERTVTANVPATGIGLSNKIRFETQTVNNYLNFGSISNATNLERAHDSNRLGLFFSPIKEVNMDIVRSLGEFNIDNYIGNPADYYQDTYTELDALRKYYFSRYTLNIYEYIQLVRYIDKSLFSTIESLVPGRAKVSSGLLIEPHYLERNKIKRYRPTAENIGNETTINVNDNVVLSHQMDNYETTITASDDVSLVGENLVYEALISEADTTVLTGSYDTYLAEIDTQEDVVIDGTYPTYLTTVNAQYTGSIIGEYRGTILTSVGFDPDSIARAGFGIWAENGHTIRTYLDKFGNIVRDRKQIYLIKEQRIVNVPENISSLDPSLGTEDVPTTFYDYKVTFLNFTDTAPTVSGDIVEVTPVDGHLPSHYRYVGDLPTGLRNSWFNGCKQTELTTLDGGAAVQTFTTNPNTLRVNETGRGSGEPILYVD